MSVATRRRTLHPHTVPAGGAAAYALPAESRHPSLPMVLTVLLVVECAALALSEEYRASLLAPLLLGLSLPLPLWLTLRFALVRRLLTAPAAVDGRLTDPRWSPFRFEGWGGDLRTAHLLPAERDGGDLVVMLHGHASSLRRLESRSQHLHERGMHVVGADMRGHGADTLRDDWTLLKVVADSEALLDALREELVTLPDRIWLYGHSMGGFVALRLAAHPSTWWSDRLAGVVLESPVTSFPLLIESRMPRLLSPFRPWIRHILRREHERIHPDLPVRYATAQIPHIGLPEVPMLVLQAADDSALGREHYDLLAEELGQACAEASLHLLLDQSHGTACDSDERRSLLESWLSSFPHLPAEAVSA